MRTPDPFGALNTAADQSPIVREINRLSMAIDEAHSIKCMMLGKLEPVTSPSWVNNQKAPRPEPASAVREVVCPIAQRIAELADAVMVQNDNYRGLTQALEI
jgi:hypothetical protein